MKTKKPAISALTLLSLLAIPAIAQLAPSGSAGGTAGSAATVPGASSAQGTTRVGSDVRSNTPAANTGAPNAPVNTPAPIDVPGGAGVPSTLFPDGAMRPVNPSLPSVNPPLNTPNPTLNPIDRTPSSVNPSTNPANPNLDPVNPNTGAINPGSNPVYPNVPDSSGVNAGAARSGTLGLPPSSTSPAIESSISGSAETRSSETNSNGVNVGASGSVGATSPAPINLLPSGSQLSSQAANMLQPGDTVREIREAQQSGRDTLYSQINSRLENSGRIISELENRGQQLSGDAKSEFKAASSALRDSEKALKRSLSDMRKASSDNWSEAQAQLASDYEAYAAAVARAQAAASSGASTSDSSSTLRR